jgi:DNA-directed RNA polymerase subunit M
MKFCPNCGSILIPRREEKAVMFVCHCGYKEIGDSKMREAVKQEVQEMGVVDKEIETLPIVNTKCPHCQNKEAYNWEIQTRAGDEAATQFFRCRKCRHTWREYK